MYSVSLLIEDINKESEGEVISNVMVITDLKAITFENLRPVAEELCKLACEKEFMRKDGR